MKLYKNIDVVQINLQDGVTEYFLPKSVDWADRVIDKIVVYAPGYQMLERSPVTGDMAIADKEYIRNLYFDFYNENGEAIVHNLSLSSLIYTNNNVVEINSKLSLQLSRIFAAGELSEDGGGCLLLYVYYGSKEIENFEVPQKNVTVTFEMLEGQEIPLSDVIDSYIYAQGKKIKGIYSWGIRGAKSGLFLTLRNRNFKTIIKDFPLEMCQAPMGAIYSEDSYAFYSQAERVQAYPFYLDDEDIDFANSTIKATIQRNTEYVYSVTLTFLY